MKLKQLALFWQKSSAIVRPFVIMLAGLICIATGLDVRAGESADAIQTEMKQLYTTIQQLTATKHCEQNSECRAIAVGARACGGPNEYIVYSVLSTDESKLQQTVEKHRMLNQRLNKLLGMVSICEMLMEPPFACINQQCVTEQAR